MNTTPSIDYSCSHCGARQIYQLVPMEASEGEQQTKVAVGEIPSIDFRCSRCGASQTYMLVPKSVPGAS